MNEYDQYFAINCEKNILLIADYKKPYTTAFLFSNYTSLGISNFIEDTFAAQVGTKPDKKFLTNIPAVLIKNLCKSYDNGPAVVSNLCMTVEKGTIYGLLGSSGCGKTTLLSCIVGLGKWDSGELRVFGKTPGSRDSGIPGKRLGFMPQDLALYNHLSIWENIQLYGRLYNLSSTEMSGELQNLTDLLKLPSKSKSIRELSGGQQRRVSLALVLIHSPELLILDEPTVGLDPLLRQSIWSHLYKIVNTRGTTILITTHYIEEARYSNTIGVMRSGRLLVEDTPSNLLTKLNCQLLEQAVLKLCRKDENERGLKVLCQQENCNILAKPAYDIELDIPSKKQNKYFHDIWNFLTCFSLIKCYQRICALTTVFLLTFLKFPAFLVMLLFMPSIQGSISILTLTSKPRELHLGVVNYDVANWTTECDMAKHSENSCDLSALSCKYLHQLQHDDLFILNSYPTEEEALTQVHLGNAWGYLTFHENYSQSALDLFSHRQFAFEESIVGSKIHVNLDYSYFIETYFMKKLLFNSYLQYLKQLAEACDVGGQEVEIPLNFRAPVYGSYDDNFAPFVLPGVIVCSMVLIISVPTCLIFIADRNQGTLSRATAAGLSTVDVIFSHLITAGIVTFGQLIIWNVILYFAFEFTIVGSFWLWAAVCLLTGLCGGALGVFCGAVCRDAVEATVVGIFLYIPFVSFGGVHSPIESIPNYLRQFGYLLPTTLPIASLRSIVSCGAGLMDPRVWPGMVVLGAWILIFCLSSFVILRFSNKK